ncbi:MAG: small ribosomal subunit biogenesis GTPase RsgA [Legionellaceae bacterium]|nr:small ribosomal subunit biogenesis GTPase RsgA [Legionellaceae bacterium]
MSKRRISKQQFARIEKKQQSYRQQQMTDEKGVTFEGLVITRYLRHAHIEDTQGNSIRCAIRPNIDSLVAGDHVVWQAEGTHQGIVVSRYPRQTELSRPDNQGHFRAIAANISQIMIVVAPIPEISWNLLDSYLVMTEYLKIPPYIVLNKTDLPCDTIQQTLLKYYEPLGYPLLFTNSADDQDKSLHKALNNQTSVFVGQSGVGKSSIIAKVLPHESSRIQTGEVSAHSNLGCHTTSNSYLYHLPTGGELIDSPGVRELSLWNMSGTDIARGYREFREYIPQCKYRNCTHYETPGCAIIQAVKNKLISLKRYENYVKILQISN